MLELFPEIEPNRTWRRKVAPPHELHVEEAGNPQGRPVVFLHGGPGAGVSPTHRRFFDPSAWRIILFDQRGSGKSTPLGSLDANTTDDLLSDIEAIRSDLGIDRWTVFGGSWGSTLAIAYAETYPDRVSALIVRGIFLGRPSEVAWTMGGGVERLYPDGWEDFLAPLSPEERKDPLHAYHSRLTSRNGADAGERIRREAALAWTRWEDRTSYLIPQLETPTTDEEIEQAVALARIEAHYFVNGAFFRPADRLLRDAGRLASIPGVIVQGRYDMVCPATSAFELHRAWPGSRLVIVPDAGHSVTEPGITHALVEATEHFKTRV